MTTPAPPSPQSTLSQSNVQRPQIGRMGNDTLLSMPARSQWQLDRQGLRRQRAAMTGLSLILAITLVALLAPWLAPYVVDEQHLDFIRAAPPISLGH